jgi:hypothetical protein
LPSTGATETRLGLFEYANGGTVFLDEVGETSLAMQAKLLRVIQNREIQQVGSPEVRQINVRLIAATNRDLRAEVLAGHFREDLFYRLSSIQIRIPSLAQRLEDIPLLRPSSAGFFDMSEIGVIRNTVQCRGELGERQTGDRCRHNSPIGSYQTQFHSLSATNQPEPPGAPRHPDLMGTRRSFLISKTSLSQGPMQLGTQRCHDERLWKSLSDCRVQEEPFLVGIRVVRVQVSG